MPLLKGLELDAIYAILGVMGAGLKQHALIAVLGFSFILFLVI
jgi:hypothetical protein